MSQSKEQFMQLRSESMAANNGISFEHLIDAKRDNLKNAVNLIANSVKDGNYDSLKGLILALKGKAFFTDLEKELRPLAEYNYLDKTDKNYSVHDVKVEQTPTKTEYDYSVCGDPVYERLVKIVTGAKEELDARAAMLKTLIKPQEMVDEETGESFRCMPPNKLQKEGLKLTIK